MLCQSPPLRNKYRDGMVLVSSVPLRDVHEMWAFPDTVFFFRIVVARPDLKRASMYLIYRLH